MNEVLIGTSNSGKFREIKSILGKVPYKLLSLRDLAGIPKTRETGQTYQANALQKARILVKATGLSVLAEDSGLETKVLGDKPGIYSARYSGKGATAERNNKKLLKELADVLLSRGPACARASAGRQARYQCVAVFMTPEGKLKITAGICEGKIAPKPHGKKGFGYDPLFIPKGYKKTFGELSAKTKNRISHRAKALRKLKPLMRRMIRIH